METEASEVGNYVTISIGCATAVPIDHQKPEELIKLADKALYTAKEAGKNRVKGKYDYLRRFRYDGNEPLRTSEMIRLTTTFYSPFLGGKNHYFSSPC